MIGQPSLYGRRTSAGVTTRTTGADFLTGFAYDSVHDRIFVRDYSVVSWWPNGRILAFDVRPDHMKNGPEAIAVFGQPDFHTRSLGEVGPKKLGSIDGTILDERNQRLIVSDGANNRVLLWDIRPERLTETPEPIVVLGQTDLMSKHSGVGPDHLNHPTALYYEDANDRLFVSDSGNNRVLVFDVRPDRLKSGASATAVIGQPDFNSRKAAAAADRLNNPMYTVHDPVNQRLFVADSGNRRILVFNDIAPNRLKNGLPASYVLGQPNFATREARHDLKKASSDLMVLDTVRQRLYLNEGMTLSRELVFDVHPSRLKNNPDAIAVLFQEDFKGTDWRVSQSRDTTPKQPWLDEKKGILYFSTSYPGGNRVLMFDVSGTVRTGMPALEGLGHLDANGKMDFEARAAFDRVNGRFVYPRAVRLDPVDHRLFVNDQYNNRVLVFQLDKDNRVLDRTASVILGQPNAFSGKLRDPSPRTMQIPLALAYDEVDKRLFVGDGRYNRVLVFDARPERLKTYAEAIAVLGQQDFQTVDGGVDPRKIDFGVRIGRGMTSTQPTPLGMAVDQKGRRLFVTDGGNHRVLVYDISEGRLQNGAAATHVIGQPNFEGSQPTPRQSVSRESRLNLAQDGAGGEGQVGKGRSTDARGFDTPSGVAYDPNHDRLFVVDGNNSRVLVFDAGASKLQDGEAAIAVLGQQDFTSGDELRLDTEKVSEDVGSRRMRMPNGIDYDSVQDRLYVADKGNDRILIFEAAPEKLKSGMAASSVIGQKDFATRIAGNGEQEEMLDPREIAFDAEHQRLYVTDSFWARVMVFDLPRTERPVELRPQEMVSYSTLDAWNGREMPELDREHSWRAKLTAQGQQAPGGMLVYSKTRQVMDPLSTRRSRILISETSVAAPKASTAALFFIDQTRGKNNLAVVSNPNAGATQVRFVFQSGRGSLEAERTLPAGGRLKAELKELFGNPADGKLGTLWIRSAQAVASLVLRETPTSRGERLLLATPGAVGVASTEPVVIAGLRQGGGYESELVLLNPHEDSIQGHIQVFGRDGEPLLFEGEAYRIKPGEVFRWTTASKATLPEEVYAVVSGNPGMKMPAASAMLRVRKGTLLLSETAIPGRPLTQNAWIPVDTLPSLIRHGRSRMSLAVANASHTPATLRLTLFDTNGQEQGRFEQILPAEDQREWSTADLFNVQQFRGTLRLWSDVPVSVSAKRATETLRGEPVESEIGYVDAAALNGRQEMELPEVSDGAGVATEIVLINPTAAPVKGRMSFASSDGQPSPIVLR